MQGQNAMNDTATQVEDGACLRGFNKKIKRTHACVGARILAWVKKTERKNKKTKRMLVWMRGPEPTRGGCA